MNQMCANPTLYDSIVENFADTDYCNFDVGQGIFGVAVTLDLFFFSYMWNFGEPIPVRDYPTCVNGHPQLPGEQSIFNKQVCPEAADYYLQDKGINDYCTGSCGGSNYQYDDCRRKCARGHWEQYYAGVPKSQIPANRVWQGRLCFHEDRFCYAAQNQYWVDYMDVADSDVYGPDMTSPVNSYLGKSHNATHFNAAKASGDTDYIWRGDLCRVGRLPLHPDPRFGFSLGNLAAQAVDYVQRNPDLAFVPERSASFYDAKGNVITNNVISDYVSFGFVEGRSSTRICRRESAVR